MLSLDPLRYPPMSDKSTQESIGVRARRAAGWQLLAGGTGFGLQMVTSLVLARLLMPRDFGIVAMATLVTGLATTFRDLGLGQALVQRQELEPKHLRAAFWGNAAMGMAICAALVLIAPSLGVYFKEPRMVPVLQAIAFLFVLSPFSVVPRAMLQRELNFRTPFFAELPASLSYGAVGITMALLGYNYWSLVAGQLTAAFVRSLALCILTRHVPQVVPSFRGIRDLFSFGLGATGVSLGHYIAVKIDYFAIGKQLNADALGLYTRAYTFVTYPSMLTSQIGPVFFPAFSRMQHDRSRMHSAFSRVVTVLSMPFFPVLTIAVVAAPELIPTILGEQWTPSVVPAQILTFIGLCSIIGAPSGAVIKATGRVYGEAWRQLLYGVLIGVGAWFAAPYGIAAVSVAVVGANIVHYSLIAHLVWQSIGFGPLDYLKAFRGPLSITAASVAAALLLRTIMLASGHGQVVVLLMTVLPSVLVALLLAISLPFPEMKVALHEYRSFYERAKSLIGRR